CPSLAIRVSSSKWEFFQDKCISCRICVTACPVGALEAEVVEGRA
ncbi:ferredoxin, partial [Thermococci archaeon]